MPNTYINRAQFAVTLFNHSGEKDYYVATSTDFTDIVENTWYYDAVCWAYDRGLINGTSSTTFHPARNITTAEALTILYRYADYLFLDTECRYDSEPVLTHSDYGSIADWAMDAMNWALDYNVLNPVSSTSALNPNVTKRIGENAGLYKNISVQAELRADIVWDDNPLVTNGNHGG